MRMNERGGKQRKAAARSQRRAAFVGLESQHIQRSHQETGQIFLLYRNYYGMTRNTHLLERLLPQRVDNRRGFACRR